MSAVSGLHIRGAYLAWSVWNGSEKVSRDYVHLDSVLEAKARLERHARRRRRACLCCRTMFSSTGFHHRLCTRCRREARETAGQMVATDHPHFSVDTYPYEG